jgi:hypothetical protein
MQNSKDCNTKSKLNKDKSNKYKEQDNLLIFKSKEINNKFKD